MCEEWVLGVKNTSLNAHLVGKNTLPVNRERKLQSHTHSLTMCRQVDGISSLYSAVTISERAHIHAHKCIVSRMLAFLNG